MAINAPPLKPTNFGTTGTYRNLSTYKTAVLDAITNRASEFNAVHSRYEEYLKWLVDNAAGVKTFFDQSLFNALKTTQPNSWKSELNVYFIEVLGPIYIIEQLGLFESSAKIDVPESAIQGAYDFAVDGAQISVKKSGGGKTNTLKPGDIVANKPFKDFISGLPEGNKKKKIYQIFEVLNEHSAVDGPIKLLYGTDGKNGLLKQLKPKAKGNDQNFMLDPSTGEVSREAKELYANDVETSINRWSKTTVISRAMREFIGDYLLYSGLGLFTISISDKNGRGTANYTTTPSGASLAGKGRASFRYGRDGEMKPAKGEKMGISMKF